MASPRAVPVVGNSSWISTMTLSTVVLPARRLRGGSPFSSHAGIRADRLLLVGGMGRVSGGLIDAAPSPGRKLLVGGLFLLGRFLQGLLPPRVAPPPGPRHQRPPPRHLLVL